MKPEITRADPLCAARCLIAPVTEEVPIGLIWALYALRQAVGTIGHAEFGTPRLRSLPGLRRRRGLPCSRAGSAPLIAVTWMACPRGCGVGWPELRGLPSWPRMHRISAARSCVPDACGAVVRTVPSRRPEPGSSAHRAAVLRRRTARWTSPGLGAPATWRVLRGSPRRLASRHPQAGQAGGVCSKPGTSSRQSFDASLRPPGRPRVHP